MAHQVSIYLMNSLIVSGQIARWMLLLQKYGFKIAYKSRRRHILIGHLWRSEIGVQHQFPNAFFIVHVQRFGDWQEYLRHREILLVIATQ